MNLLVSACLLGVECRYKGDAKANPAVIALRDKYNLIPVCPEQLGGLPTPRLPSEQKDGRVYSSAGDDVTEAFERGARETARIAQLAGCRAAVLKSRSPSCGCGRIYDGTFRGNLVPGDGKAAALLRKNGIKVYTEEDFSALKDE